MHYSRKYTLYKAACGVYRVRYGVGFEKQAANLTTTWKSIREAGPWLWNAARRMFGGRSVAVNASRATTEAERIAERLNSIRVSMKNIESKAPAGTMRGYVSKQELERYNELKAERTALTRQLKTIQSSELLDADVTAEIARIERQANPAKVQEAVKPVPKPAVSEARIERQENPVKVQEAVKPVPKPAVSEQPQVEPLSPVVRVTMNPGRSSQEVFGPKADDRNFFNRWSDRLDQFNEKHPYIAGNDASGLFRG